MGIKVANTKVSSKSSRAVSSALGLLVILAFVAYTSRDAWGLYALSEQTGLEAELDDLVLPEPVLESAIPHTSAQASAQDDSLRVEQIFSGIKLEIEDSGSSTSLRRASATRVASSAEVVKADVVHGSRNYKPQSPSFDPEVNFQEILSTSPVVIFIDSKENSQLLRTLLQRHYEVSPPPVLVDLEKHSSGAQLESYIEDFKLERPDGTAKKTSAKSSHDAPYLFINGHSVINTDFQTDIQDLHVHNQLLDKLKSVAEGNVMFTRNNAPSNS
ncbi:LANO_0H15852g1_1 [Lachancea nothofagi CBS 11611]|uniref:LANO_0H15852g1_1 n=1 Tax=Lachancea nothofagi CBS 11611 TaxID=1266666 RepID=A0A1G4KMM1_9SACH|nr:LANO_0H15852g1_1 [Lachancea nothofagi CBS 11611]